LLQALALGLAGVANGAGDIAGQRRRIEHDQMAGVGPATWVMARFAGAIPWLVIQAVWTTFVVSSVLALPGSGGMRGFGVFLLLAASTAVAMAFSAYAKSAARAAVACAVSGFVLVPLCGVVLAPPEVLAGVARAVFPPFWGWSGALQALGGSPHRDAVLMVAGRDLVAPVLGFGVLVVQAAAGLAVAIRGCSRHDRPSRGG
jgi:hypothetical protein